jgi:hypothetical protein
MSFKQQILKIIFMCLISLISLLIFFSKSVYSLGADTAHPYIALEGCKLWPLLDPTAPPEAIAEFRKYCSDPDSKLPQGSRDEDYNPVYKISTGEDRFRFIPGNAALFHSYSGWQGLGDGGYCATILGRPTPVCGESAVTWGEKLFNEAVNQYAMQQIEPAYYFLGRVAHLLGDMSTPAHVHGDVHSLQWEFKETGTTISLSRKPEAIDQDLFELFMDDFYVQWGAKDVTSVPEFSSIRSLFNDLIPITKKYPSNDAVNPAAFDWKWTLTPTYYEGYKVEYIDIKISSTGGFIPETVRPAGALKSDGTIEWAINYNETLSFQLIDSSKPVSFSYSVYTPSGIGGSIIKVISDVQAYSLQDDEFRNSRGIEKDGLKIEVDTISHKDYADNSDKSSATCREIGENLIPSAIAYTASLYKLF